MPNVKARILLTPSSGKSFKTINTLIKQSNTLIEQSFTTSLECILTEALSKSLLLLHHCFVEKVGLLTACFMYKITLKYRIAGYFRGGKFSRILRIDLYSRIFSP